MRDRRLKQLARLGKLTAMTKDATLAKLARLKNADDALRQQIEDLRKPGSGATMGMKDGCNLAQAQRLESAYRDWCSQKIRELNRQRAALRVESEAARNEALRALGKDKAISELENRVRGRSEVR